VFRTLILPSRSCEARKNTSSSRWRVRLCSRLGLERLHFNAAWLVTLCRLPWACSPVFSAIRAPALAGSVRQGMGRTCGRLAIAVDGWLPGGVPTGGHLAVVIVTGDLAAAAGPAELRPSSLLDGWSQLPRDSADARVRGLRAPPRVHVRLMWISQSNERLAAQCRGATQSPAHLN